MTIRTRLEALEEQTPARLSAIRVEAERRAKAIADLFAQAERPDASPDVRARAARVRELLAIGEARMERAQREPWKGAP